MKTLFMLLSILVTGPAFASTIQYVKNQADYQKLILDAKTPVLAVYFDPGCPHCQDYAPILEEVSKSFQESELSFVKIDVTIFTTGWKTYSIPETHFMKRNEKGQMTDGYHAGVITKDKLLSYLKETFLATVTPAQSRPASDSVRVKP